MTELHMCPRCGARYSDPDDIIRCVEAHEILDEMGLTIAEELGPLTIELEKICPHPSTKTNDGLVTCTSCEQRIQRGFS